MSSMRTRGQKLKQQQLGIPESPALQLATPPRRSRVVKKSSKLGKQDKQSSLDSSSETHFNSNQSLESPTPSQQPTAVGASSIAEELEPLSQQQTAVSASSIIEELEPVCDELFDQLFAGDAAAPPPAPPAVAAAPHTILHFWMNTTSEDLASARPSSGPSIAMALPSDLIPDLLQYIARLANSKNVSPAGLNVSSIGLSPQTETLKPTKRKGAFSRMPLQDLDNSFTRGPVYTKDGNLQIGRIPTAQPTTAHSNEMDGLELARDDADTDDVGQADADQIMQPAQRNSVATQTDFDNSMATQIPGENPPATQAPVENPRAIQAPVENPTAIQAPVETPPAIQAPVENPPAIQAPVENPIAIHAPVENPAVAGTPREGRWGFNNIFRSARSVSKLIPGLTPRAPPAVAPAVAAPLVAENIPATVPLAPATAPPVAALPAPASYVAPPLVADNPPAAVPHTPANVDHRSTSNITPSLQSGSAPSEGSQADATLQNSYERVRDGPNKFARGTYFSQPGRETESEAHITRGRATVAEADMGTTPGRKRKRRPTPDKIPNPKGCSYGMDMDYFGYSSDDEEEEVKTPTNAPAAKHRRVGPSYVREVPPDPYRKDRLKPYTGEFFRSTTFQAGPRRSNYQEGNEEGNVFNNVSAPKTAKSPRKQRKTKEPVRRQPTDCDVIITNWAGHFRVPSPSSSDSDPEDIPEKTPKQVVSSTQPATENQGASHPGSASPRKSPPKGNEPATETQGASHPGSASPRTSPPKGNEPATRPESSTSSGIISEQQSPSKAATSTLETPTSTSETLTSTSETAPTTWTQPPPPRPMPSHAALPTGPVRDSEALARVRKRALQHQPHKPSGLRASSRMSSPRVLESLARGLAQDQTAGASPNEGQQPEMEVDDESVAMPGVITEADPLFTYVRDPKVEAVLDAHWTPEHTYEAGESFARMYAEWRAKQ